MGDTTSARAAGAEGAQGEEKGSTKMAKGGKVPFHDLFKNADMTDVVLMLVGTVGALAKIGRASCRERVYVLV